MKKEDLLWIIIRAFGVYCIVHLVLLLPSTIASAYSLAKIAALSIPTSLAALSGASAGSGDLALTTIAAVRSTYETAVVKGIVSLLLWGCASWYLLRRGTLLFNILNRAMERDTKVSQDISGH